MTDYSKMPVKCASNKWFNTVIKGIHGLTFVDVPNTNAKNYMVSLTINNSNIIEKHINSNFDYNANFSKKIFDYYGGKSIIGTSDKIIIQHIIRMIDIENSTNKWRMKKKNKQALLNMVDYICNPKGGFWKRVSSGDINLVDDLANAAKSYNSSAGVHAVSLASKICRFFNNICYGRDDYYAYDSVVIHVISFYFSAYNLNSISKLSDYKVLHNSLDTIKNQVCPTLSRLQIDHLLWYCYRFEK